MILMQNTKKIINHHKKKIIELKKHNRSYYINDNPRISDSAYDDLKKEIVELENKYSFLKKKKDSVHKIVGSNPSNKFKKIKHLLPMLSLSNAFSENDIKDFIKNANH